MANKLPSTGNSKPYSNVQMSNIIMGEIGTARSPQQLKSDIKFPRRSYKQPPGKGAGLVSLVCSSFSKKRKVWLAACTFFFYFVLFSVFFLL